MQNLEIDKVLLLKELSDVVTEKVETMPDIKDFKEKRQNRKLKKLLKEIKNWSEELKNENTTAN